VEYKYNRLFAYKPLDSGEAFRGRVGVPRAMNIYENYPLWHTVLTDLGFRVELSPRSSKTVYEKGQHSIPSDTICYPAKLAHGHIQALLETNVPLIFFPTVIAEKKETSFVFHYNCPILQGYPTVIKANVSGLRNAGTVYLSPTLDLENQAAVIEELLRVFRVFGVARDEMTRAVCHGYEEQAAYRRDIRDKGEEALAHIRATGGRGIVLAGRPYHIDPEINHGISKLIVSEGLHVLTEDSIFHRSAPEELRINNKWVYDTRIFLAAQTAAKSKDLEFILLNSFGCGTDSIIVEQVDEILKQYGKLTTILRIDEISNLGAINIRVRSLKAAVKDRALANFAPEKRHDRNDHVHFTADMKAKHTILIPAMYPIREKGLLDLALEEEGYKTAYLNFETSAAEIGLRYVNNDYCHTVFDYVGQIARALQSGKYDINQVSVMMFDSLDCPCRGSNFGPVIRKALNDMGYPQIPMISYMALYKDFKGTVEENAGFRLTQSLLKRMLLADSYGVLFEKIIPRTRPYEREKGQIDRLHDSWMKRVAENIRNASLRQFNIDMKEIIRQFDETPLNETPVKPKVGMVGDQEIPIDFSLEGENNIVRLLESEGAEVVIPGYGYAGTYNLVEMGEKDKAQRFYDLVDHAMDLELRASRRFRGLYSIFDMSKTSNEIAPYANFNNNFWFAMGGRTIELLKDGVNNIVNFESFNCTLNYVAGIGLNKEIKRLYPDANIVDIDYALGIPAVNQINRIRLMLAKAKRELEKEASAPRALQASPA
jgi:predicted nucleotide-binding protein (sugar kinase/HSP70/actin superfamily)